MSAGRSSSPRTTSSAPVRTFVREGRNVTLTRLPVVGRRWLDSTPYLPDDLKPVPPALKDRPFTTPEVNVHNYHFIVPNGLSDHKAQQFVISTR